MTALAVIVLVGLGVIAGYCKQHVSEEAAVTAFIVSSGASALLAVLTLV